MASQWYVLHGGKTHGPLTSANLKKLADEGKITPATSVRLGAEGAWVNASKVQGLFPPTADTSPGKAQAAPARVAAARSVSQNPNPTQKPAAPPVAPPPAPPRADPLARVPLPKAMPLGKSAAAETPSLAPKVLGAVALILGILALATCWLPVVGGLMAWTGIIVGSLGLLLGTSALVVSALGKGSGLMVSVAGTSTSLVGLVLTVFLGLHFGLFQGAPPVVIAKVLPPVVQPKPPVAPPKEPEPEPEPEPQWFDAGEAIEQGDIRARIVPAGIEKVRLESMDPSILKAAKPQPMLVVRISIENIAQDKIIEVPGWSGSADLVNQGVKDLLGNSDLGKAMQSSSASAVLKDNFGNPYKQTPPIMLMGAGLKLENGHPVRPGKIANPELVFDVPLGTIEFLRLELSPAGFSGTEPLRFQIPKAKITGMQGLRQYAIARAEVALLEAFATESAEFTERDTLDAIPRHAIGRDASSTAKRKGCS